MNRIVTFLLALLLPAVAFADVIYIPPYGYYESNANGEYHLVGSSDPHYATIDPYRWTYGQRDMHGETSRNIYNTFDYAAPQDRPNYYPNDGYGNDDGYYYNTSSPSYSGYYQSQPYYDSNNGYVRCTVTTSTGPDSNGNYRVVRTCTDAHGQNWSSSYDQPGYNSNGYYNSYPCRY